MLDEFWSKDFGADVLAYLRQLAESVVFIAGVEEAPGAVAVEGDRLEGERSRKSGGQA